MSTSKIVILTFLIIAVIGFTVVTFVIPGKEIIIVNQETQLASPTDFQGEISEKRDDDQGPASIVSKNIVPAYLQDFTKMKSNLLRNEGKFIEIDLDKMKAGLYQEGEKIEEFPILARGNPYRWGGTPMGVYPVLSKHKIAFSNLSRVYMPYAIEFYGKYYLHGQPYYPGGRLLQSPVSAGCVRFLNKHAREIYNFAEKGMPILVIDKKSKNDDYKYPSKPITPFPEISAESYLVADLNNGFILAEKNFSQKLSIASITKLMTAIVVAGNVDFRKSVLVTQEMVEPFKSYSWFRPKLEVGKRYRVVELFYPLLTESSNDVAEALSYFLGKEKTVQMMNEKAEAIGMANTKFVEPTGLDQKNISTAQDLFYLGRYVLSSFSPLLKITKSEEIPGFGPGRFKNLGNKNILFDHPNFIGGKTGFFTKHAGLFLLEFTTKDNQLRDVSIVILDSDDLENDLSQILKWLEENYFTIGPVKPNLPPIAAVSCDPSSDCGTSDCRASRGCLFHFRNHSTDPDGQDNIVKSEWDILNWGSSPDIACQSPNPLCDFTPQTIMLSPGTYKIKLYVEDKRGASDKAFVDFILKENR